MKELLSVNAYLVEFGVASVLLAIFIWVIFGHAKKSVKKADHDGVLSDRTAAHYLKVIETLQQALKFQQEQAAETMAAYKQFVEQSIVARLNHCEEQHKTAEREKIALDMRLGEAHRRLDTAHSQLEGMVLKLQETNDQVRALRDNMSSSLRAMSDIVSPKN